MPYSKQNPTLELAQSFLDSLVSLARRGFLLCGSRVDSVDILCVRGALLRSSRVAIATCPVDCRTSYSFLCCTLVLLKRLARVFESIQVKQRQDARLKRSVVVGWLSCSKAISTVGGGERRLKKKKVVESADLLVPPQVCKVWLTEWRLPQPFKNRSEAAPMC